MKLQSKLIIAFSIIVLIMGISQSIFLQKKNQEIFKNYLEQQKVGFAERMQQTFVLYYEENGSWENVQQTIFNRGLSMGRGNGMMKHGQFMNMGMQNFDVLLLDMNGNIIADSTDTRIGMSGSNLNGFTLDVIVNEKKKGTLVFHQYKLQELEQEFLKSSNTAIIFSGFITVVLAVLFSFWIARKMLTPLKDLTIGIQRIADGEKFNHVHIKTNDEFHDLGEAFNHMSQKLERNEEIRQSLVADVAHELRTPLTILQGKLESIQEGAIEATEETILELTDEVYRMNRLVNDLQQLSLAEAGMLPLHKQKVEMKTFIGRICLHLQWLADEKGITLKYGQIPDECYLDIDTDRMTQVIVNLVGNALRYTPEKGKVEVSIREEGDKLLIQIADTGPGIPDEAIPFIFERFYKTERSRTRHEGGTGLGLSIAKGFVEAHGGKISVESEINNGTTFTILFPKLEQSSIN